MAALEVGDLAAAEDNALSAMELFEISAENIGELLEVQEATIQPLGLGTAAASIFNVQEEITDLDNEANELRELTKINNFDDVDFSAYDESVNLAKTLLADGYVPDAQAQLALANDIKNNLYDQIDAAVVESQDERVQEFVDNSKDAIEEMLENGENLGLTKKAIKELEDVLEAIENGQTDEVLDKTDEDSELAKELDDDETQEDAPGNSGDAPGNSGDAPGNSGDAPGQNRDNEEAELPPGFGAAGDNPSENGLANGQGLGLGKIPPGLAKLFGYDDGTGDNVDFVAPEGLPPGFGAAGDNPSENGLANGQGLGLGNIPPGQLKKFDVGLSFVYSPDDYFDDAIDDLIEDNFEDKYDKLFKNSKAKEKKDKEAQGKANAIGNSGGGNPNCSNEGVTDNDPGNTSGNVGVPYTVEDFTAVGSSCKVADPGQINIQVWGPSPPPWNLNQGDSFTPIEAGIHTITASFQGQFLDRIVTVVGGNSPPSIDSISADFSVNEGTNGHSLTATASDPDVGDTLTYAWTFSGEGPITVTMYNEDTLNPTFDVSTFGGSQSRDITFTLTVTDDSGAPNDTATDTVVVTVNHV